MYEALRGWAKAIPKPDGISFQDEIARLRDFSDGSGAMSFPDNDADGKLVRFDRLPDPAQKSVKHIWMWGTDDDRRRLAVGDYGDGATIDEVIVKKQATPVEATVSKVAKVQNAAMERLDDDDTLGVVRQPIILFGSKLSPVAQHELKSIKSGLKTMERGLYYGLTKAPMLGIHEDEVAELTGRAVDDITASVVREALDLAPGERLHEPVFMWLAEHSLCIAAHAKYDRGHGVWYVPLMPASLARTAGWIGEWSWV